MTGSDRGGRLVLPFYVLADVSYSMSGTALDALNSIVPEMKDAFDINPILSDKVLFSLIDFSDDARTQIPLCDLLDVSLDSVPRLVARGGTSYAAAFRWARKQIEADLRGLKLDGYRVYRPAVFFLTDGQPTDDPADWERAFFELIRPDFGARPNIIPFGFGAADVAVLDKIAYPAGRMRAFLAREGTNPGAAIRSMAEILIQSIVASANSVASLGEGGGFILPSVDEDDVWL
jgi:uncharacterized protein YegL